MAAKFVSVSRFRELAERGDADGAAVARRATVARVSNDDSRTIRFCLSDESVDRMGDSIKADGWEYRDFLRNPVCLWAHDANAPPIGRLRNLHVAGRRLMGDVEFAAPEVYEFGDQVFRLIKAGYISAGSVGFTPIEWKWVEDKGRPYGIDFLKQELLEFSVVPLPANANALVEGRSLRSRWVDADPIRELGRELGRLARARRLRDALPPSPMQQWERRELAERLRRQILED